MKINEDSWMVKLIDFTFQPNNFITNGCKFFKLLLLSIFMIPLGSWMCLIPILFIKDENNRPPGIIGFLLLTSLTALVWVLTWKGNGIVIKPTLINFLIFPYIILGCFIIFLFILSLIVIGIKKIPNFFSLGKLKLRFTLNRDYILIEYIKSIKDKYCPKIEYVKKDQQNI